MRKLLSACFIGLVATGFSQEVLSPIGAVNRGEKKTSQLKSTPTVDSTFIYSFDTLSLPFLDEFSRSKFPSMNAQPGDANVTEQKYYYLTDMADVPLANTIKFSTQPTKRYVTSAGTTTESDLPLISIKVANFQYFPIQYLVSQVYPPYNIYDTLDYVNPIDTIALSNPDLGQDSVTVFFAHVTDPNVLWTDNFAFHNYTFAKNPWTLGVATFDGLDASGYPYAINTTQEGVADYLTSKVIDLSTAVPNDSIYLSFLYQFEGFSDPAESNDSLVLEYYDQANDEWDWVWSHKGIPVSDFKLVHLRITDAAYLTNGFRFRFKNYGGLSGLLDIVNLDYVHLRANSGYQDTLFKDFAFVYPVSSLVDTYTQVPYEHWKSSPTHMNPKVKVVVRNGSNLTENNMNGTVDVFHNSILEGTFTMIAQDLSGGNINYAPRTSYQSLHDFTGSYVFSSTSDSIKTFDIIGHVSAQFPNLSLNDSSFTKQVFENVYAYDDGTAEQAYGISQAQARMAVKFTPYKADTLMGVRIYFAPTVHDWSNKLFMLTVWGDNSGVPGSVIYEDNFFNPRTPIYEDERGKFTDYLFPSRIPMTASTFYVGTRQVDPQPLNVGFDRNNPQTNKLFYSINGGLSWTASSLQGIPMVRPLFQTLDNMTLAVQESTNEVEWSVFPNPTNGDATVSWRSTTDFPGAVLVDAQGRIIQELAANEFTLNLSNCVSGIYFLKLNNAAHTLKIIR